MSRIKFNRFVPLKAIMHLITMVPLEKIKYIEEFNRCEVDGVLKCQIEPLLLKDFGEALIPKASLTSEFTNKLRDDVSLSMNDVSLSMNADQKLYIILYVLLVKL